MRFTLEFSSATASAMQISEPVLDIPPVTQDELLTFGATTYEAMPKADTLLISCGALNTLRLLDPLEKRCKVPVVSSAPHALWASVRLLGLSGQVKGYGRLLARA